VKQERGFGASDELILWHVAILCIAQDRVNPTRTNFGKDLVNRTNLCDDVHMNEPQSDVEIPPWDVADRMGKAMHASGVTLAEMALYLGCHRNTVTNYLRGRSKPSRATLIAWADKTRFPLDWLETGEQSANPPPDGRPLRVTGNDRYPVAA